MILAVYSGIIEDDYQTLSRIAPTVAQSGSYVDFGMPWKEEAATIGKALGREAQAAEAVDAVDRDFARALREHPELEASTFAMADAGTGRVYVYGSQDLRARCFTSLGMKSPAAIEKLKRVVYLDPTSDVANALGFSSPLSLPYAIDHGVPQLAEALDGRP